MVKKPLPLVIDDDAKEQLRKAHNHIKQNSPQAAEKVKKRGVTASFHAVLQNIELHAPDKYKADNDGSYRAYELFHYRIAYHVTETQITIVRIRHAKMNPLYY